MNFPPLLPTLRDFLRPSGKPRTLRGLGPPEPPSCSEVTDWSYETPLPKITRGEVRALLAKERVKSK